MRRIFLYVVPTMSLLLGASVSSGQEYQQKLKAVSEFLMSHDEEADLARSAAPPTVTADATIWVFTTAGYETHASGTNGFHCLVQRGWSSPFAVEDVFFDPRLLAPICFNKEAARTSMVEYFRRTELVLEGHSRRDVARQVLVEVASGQLPLPHRAAVAYMMSPRQWIGTEVGRWMPHVMVYGPHLSQEDLGAHEIDSGMPLVFEHNGGPLATVVIPVPRWSTGEWAVPARQNGS